MHVSNTYVMRLGALGVKQIAIDHACIPEPQDMARKFDGYRKATPRIVLDGQVGLDRGSNARPQPVDRIPQAAKLFGDCQVS